MLLHINDVNYDFIIYSITLYTDHYGSVLLPYIIKKMKESFIITRNKSVSKGS